MIKSILAIVLLISVINCQYNNTTKLTPNFQDQDYQDFLTSALLFVEGFQASIDYYSNVTSFYPCLSYAGVMLNSLSELIQAAQSGNITEILREIPILINSASNANVSCRAMITESRYFQIGLVNQFQEQVKSKGWINLLLNGPKVVQDINTIKDRTASGDWYIVGESYGDILEIFIYGHSASFENYHKIDWVQFAHKIGYTILKNSLEQQQQNIQI